MPLRWQNKPRFDASRPASGRLPARNSYPQKTEFTAVTTGSDLAKINAVQGEQRANSAIPSRSIKPANSSAAPSLINSRCPTS